MAVDSTQRPATWLGAQAKLLSLIFLMFQNSILILILHYSRIMPLVDGHRYLPSTAVLTSEIMKLAISLTMALYDLARKHPNAAVTTLFGDLFASVFSGDSWKLAIPAFLYTVQNFLQYVAISNLNASTFQITYQLKIIATAVFSVILLGRPLSGRKWLALLCLTIGVAIVQVDGSSLSEDLIALREGVQLDYWLPQAFFSRGAEQVKAVGKRTLDVLMRRSATYQGIDEDFALLNPRFNRALGIIAVLIACLSSGLAGVYFEKILKEHNMRASRSGSRSHISFWVRNVQLSFYSLFPALILGVVLKDGEQIARFGFYVGYNWVVWLTVALQAVGGVLVALVIQYADNIAKNFATSISIMISFIASVYFFDLAITFQYVLGTGIVVFATLLYNAPDERDTEGPTVKIEDYEKEHVVRPEQGYFDLLNDSPGRIPKTPSMVELAFTSSSRPGSPRLERHHHRVPSGRRAFDKRES